MTGIEKNATTVKPFHKRGLVVFVIGLSAVVLLISGVVIFIAPSTRIADASHWTLIRLDKDGWVNLHNVYALVFVAGVIWHMVFNWKPFRNYIVTRTTRHLNLKREMLSAIAVSLIFVVLVAQNLPPVDSLTDLTAYFRHEFWK